MRIVNDLVDKTQTAIQEMGAGGFTGLLQRSMHAVKNSTALHTELYVDIWTSQAMLLNKTHDSWKYLVPYNTGDINTTGYTFRYKSGLQPLPRKIGDPIAAACIVVIDEYLLQDKACCFELERLSSEYGFMLLLNYTADENNARQAKFNFYGKQVIIPCGTDQAPGTVQELLEQQLTPTLRHEVQLKQSLNSIQPLLTLVRDAIQKESGLIPLRKNVYQQEQVLQRRDESQGNTADVNNTVKSLLQNAIADNEREHKSKYEELLKPQTGRFSILVLKEAGQFSEFDKFDIAEKSEKLGIAIPEKFQQHMLAKIVTEIRTDFGTDQNLLLNNLDQACKKANHILTEKKLLPPSAKGIGFDAGQFPDYKKIITNYSYYNKQYNGELVKKGATEYFIALREYTGLIMVVAGLLAPLNMIASISDNHILKNMSVGIRIATGIITIVMVVWGYFDLRKRIPRKRTEELQKETARAREHLVAEGKRIFSDSGKDWTSQVNYWLRDVYSSFGQQLEKIMKEYQNGMQEKNNENKQKIQLMQSGLDNISRRLDTAFKLAETNLRTCKDQVYDCDKKIKELSK